jgi:hypothetical protein
MLIAVLLKNNTRHCSQSYASNPSASCSLQTRILHVRSQLNSPTEIQPTFYYLRCVRMRKATIGFIMSVYSSIHVYQDNFRRKYFREISYLILLIKCDDMLRFRIKSNKNKGYFTCIPMYIHDSRT